ncbi:hypothetical protein A2377_03795 [Candidatus Roizmanbacteria bacterium RIFOXYB1_FULL_41_27]|nr:MAG: hypothetical protein A2377_03795 [Candidatus Roizmanbacteria bacterium RIFOXYB1_FULL_41_27]
MQTKPNKTPYSPYLYTTTNQFHIKTLYFFRILTWLMVVAGYAMFFSHYPLYWLLFAPIIIFFTIYYILSYAINLFYQKFDVKQHNKVKRQFWKKLGIQPSIDIYLPVCGESISMIKKTFIAAKAINYKNKQIYILDDKGNVDVKALANRLKINYLSRPNKGEMKKAGNLKYAFAHTHGDFFVVFDADFVAHSDFITELLPYMSDEKIGIVQTPQHFLATNELHTKSPLEFGAAGVQEDFYRVIQVARNRFGSSICVGTNAIYRRLAIAKIGGPYQIEHSEDVHTGFALIENGYAIKYIPLIFAYGICPNNLLSYFHQQHRWCSGTMSLFLSGKLFSYKLTLAQKLCYITGLLYYISHPLGLIMSFQIFTVVLFHPEWLIFAHLLPFVPFLVYTRLVLPLTKLTRPKVGSYLAYAAVTYNYTYAVFSNIFGIKLSWVPTNGTNLNVSQDFLRLVLLNKIYLLTYTVLVVLILAVTLYRSMYQALSITPFNIILYICIFAWVGYNIFLHTIFYRHALKFVTLKSNNL